MTRVTDRQMQMLRLKAEGHTNRVIANKVGLHEQTVKNHLLDAYRTLGATNIVEAMQALGWVKVR